MVYTEIYNDRKLGRITVAHKPPTWADELNEMLAPN